MASKGDLMAPCGARTSKQWLYSLQPIHGKAQKFELDIDLYDPLLSTRPHRCVCGA